MSNAISTSGFSPYGQEVLKRMSVDADFLKSYLKTQGRLYMFPVAVALEFYAQMPNVQFVGTKEQWEKLGYSISQEQDGIKFVDSKANTYNLYEISQLENVKQPPTSWQVTSQNMDFVKNELCKMYSITPDDKTSVLSLVLKNEAVNSDVFDCKKAMNVPEEKENIFFRNYANALALVCAGRLEINNVLSYNVNIDTDYFKELNENEKFLFLSYVKKTAFACLENLKSIVAEYNKQRRINHEIRRMDETVNRTEEKHTDSRVPDNSTNGISDELTDKINNSVQSGQTADRTGNNAENSENGKNNINAVLENETELGESRTDDALRSERNGRNIQSDNGDTARTDNGGRTDRTIWTGMDENDAGRLPDRDGNSTVSAQIPDGSKKSGRDGGAELGSTGRTVQESEPRTENEYDRENELDVRNAESERYSNERLRSDAVFNSNTGRLKLTEQEFAKVVHEAFDEAYTKHSDLIVVPQERGKKLYERLANQVITNHIESENVISKAFRSRSDFGKTYGSIGKMDATYFGHKLDVIEKEIEDNIHIKTASLMNSKNAVSSNANVIITADAYRTELARELPNSLVAIPLEDAVSDELLSRAEEKGYSFTGTILTPNAVVDVAQARKNIEIVTNGEYFNILGVNIDNGYNIKTIEASQLLTSEEIKIMQTIASNSVAELKRSKLIEEEQNKIANNLLENAKKAIADFLEKENFGTGDFSDLTKIDLAYTTLEDDENIEIQVSADLENTAISTYVNGYLFNVEGYDSLEDMTRDALSVMTFDDLVAVDTDEVKKFLVKNGVLTQEETVETVSADEIAVSQIVVDFRAKTEEKFHKINELTATDIESIVKGDVERILSESNIAGEVGEVILSGSRCRGLEHDNSDIDVVVEIKNAELKEDALFNIIHEDSSSIYGFAIDVNPIRPEETGTLEEYLPTVESYLDEKANSEKIEEPKLELQIGDKFRNKRNNEVLEVVSLTGALPWYTDECAVSKIEGNFVITSNMRQAELLDTSKYERISEEMENKLDGKFYVYQMKSGEKYHYQRFEGLDSLRQQNFLPCISDYDLVYTGNYDTNNNDILNELYHKLNTNIPSDFKGHSLSVSDVIVLESNGEKISHFVDNVGFEDLPDFFTEREVVEEVIPSEEELIYIGIEFKDKFENIYTQDWSNHGKIRKANDEDTLICVKKTDWKAFLENQLKDYDYKTNPPTIKCEWSENRAFEEGKTYSLAEFDLIMDKADTEYVNGKEKTLKRIGSWDNAKNDADFQYMGYDKTKFTLYIDGIGEFTDRQDIGDGFGGVIDFFSKFSTYEPLIPMLRECFEYQLEEEKNKLAEMKAELDIMKSVKEQADTPTEKPETLEIGDVISYEGKEWKLAEITNNGFILNFEKVNIEDSDDLQTYSFSHIGGIDSFIKSHDFILVRKADTIENAPETADKPIVDVEYTDVAPEITSESNIKEWYTNTFPTDNLGAEIADAATFKDIDFVGEYSNTYDVIGLRDSVVRERIEEKYAEITSSEKETFDTATIYQLKDEHEDYLFESFDRLEKHGKEPLGIDAYNKVYTEDLEQHRAITVETTLENIWEKFNINRPSDFTGHSLSKSDVVVIREDNIETAFYVDEHGFMELPNFFNSNQTPNLTEKGNSNEIYQVITNGGDDGGIDWKKEYATIDDAINNGKNYIPEFLGFCVLNRETKKIEHIEGEFPLERAFSPELLRANGYINEAEEAEQLLDADSETEFTVEKPKRIGNSYAHRLYKLFTEQFPDIANGSHSFERYGKKYDENGDNDALEPLSVEHIGGNRYSFMYWYVQNGDLMRDPDFEFILDHEKQELIIQEYQLDGAICGTIYERTVDENGNYDSKLLNSLNANFLNILKNNAVLDRQLTAFTNKDGEEIVVNEDADSEIPVNAETEEFGIEEFNKIIDNDISAVCREALNELAREYELGELNLIESSTGWIVSEKFPDDTNVNIMYLDIPNGVNNETVREAINQWKEQNDNIIPRYIRDRLDETLNRNDGKRNPLPDVQSLPKITYAERPMNKFADNINALKELKRLEEATANGNRLYRIEDKDDKDYYSYDRTINPIYTKEMSDNILRKYSGWGGLSQILDERFKQHEGKRKELRELVSEKEYKQILRSTLTAFYTPQTVIDAMYKAVSNMDMPYNARILEPSCATGNFFSRLPSRYRNAQITGVEIEDTTSKIAKYLNNHNDNVKILNMGFEQTNFDNNSFDLVIGNVPFSENKMIDPEYQTDLKIHDAFFRKAIDKVEVGGIVAFITTSGTLDKKSSKTREMFAEKADLIGAIRLPSNVFGGTEVTSDIIFLQKRETPLDPLTPKPDWCYVAPVEMNKEGSDEKVTEYINSYFVKNPKMILGKMEQSTYQNRKTCVPYKDKDFTEQLDEAIKNISAVFKVEAQERRLNSINKPEPWGKKFTFQVKDDTVYYRNNNSMDEFKPKGSTKKQKAVEIEKMKALIELRDIIRELVNKQSTNITDEGLVPLRNNLNEKYDAFVAKYKTNLSSADTKSLFGNDIDYPLLFSIEEKTEKEINGQTVVEYVKSPIFFERTVNPNVEINSVDSEEEALQVSLNMKGCVNITYMALLMQSSYPNSSIEETSQLIFENLLEKGHIFVDPSKEIIGREYSGVVDRAEYLSGNVRRKLAIAEDMASKEPERYQRNVEALTAVIPENIPAEDISVRIGVPWVDEKDYEDFLFELSGRKEYERTDHRVKHILALGSFEIRNTGMAQNFNVNEKTTYGISSSWNMYKIAEKMMNQKNMQVHYKDEQGNNCGIDLDSTKAVNKCAEKIQKAFKEWIFKDAARKEKYVERYNTIYNSIVGRKYDGSNLTINGLNNGMKLRPYQLDCIARTIYGGNTLASHVVGAGKSAVMFSSIMKKKQLGLINRACVVVPKALVEQTANEWRKFYPDAKLLTISAKDIGTEKNRLYFSAKVATGNFDGVIMSNEQFEKIPCTPEFVAEHKQKQIDELEHHMQIEIEKEGKDSSSVKKIQSKIEKYERELDALYSARSKARGKDNILYFEELGFDYLVVDEAHKYKNGHFFTKMERLAGVSPKKTGISADMHMKTDYLNEILGNGHVLFATGTPVTNSMQELYTMTRYLRPDILKDSNTHLFDNWASTFGEVVTKDVMSIRGVIEPKTSFSRFTNLPELMGTYKEFADVQTQKKLNLPRPKLLGGKAQVITVEASKEQKEWIQRIAERARTLQHSKEVFRPNGIKDGMPVLSGEARLLGLGNKMVKALYEREQIPLPVDFEENEPSKIDACINKVKEIYDKRNDIGDDKAVQLIFSDIAIHDTDGKNKEKQAGKFSAYKYIKTELIKKGIPEEEIIFAPTSKDKDKADIFKKINEGKYRVVIASTETLGTGANIQQNLYALHHLDIPHRPSDFEQREGRILRFGNTHDEVEIFNYVTKGTFDGMFYENVLNKARFISQILDDENPARVCEDADEKVLTYGEIVAVAQDNKELNKLYELKNKLTELQIAYSRYQGDTIELRRELPNAYQKKALAEERVKQLETDKSNAPKQLIVTTNDGAELTETKDINAYLSKLIDNVNNKSKINQIDTVQIGNFKAKYVAPIYEGDIAKIHVKGVLQYTIEVSRNRTAGEIDGTLSNKLRTLFEKGLDKRIAEQNEILNESISFIEQAEKRIDEPFDELDLLKQTELEVEELQNKIYTEQAEDLKNSSQNTDDIDNNINDDDENTDTISL